MFEPLTVLTATVFSALGAVAKSDEVKAVLGQAGNVVTSIVSNRLDPLLPDFVRNAKDAMTGRDGALPTNHDAAKSVRRAHVQALRATLASYTKSEFADTEAVRWVRDHALVWVNRQHNAVTGEVDTDGWPSAVALAGALTDALATAKDNDVRALAEREAWREFELFTRPAPGQSAPQSFHAFFLGQVGDRPWYEAFAVCVGKEIKEDQRFRDIFTATSLVDLRAAVSALAERSAKAAARLQEIVEAGFASLNERLDRLDADAQHLIAKADESAALAQATHEAVARVERRLDDGRDPALLRRFVRHRDDPSFDVEREAILPQPFYDRAYNTLLASQLVVISGPPHMGKTTLARRMALELTAQRPNLEIVDIAQSGFEVLTAPRDLVNLVVIMHDPFDPSERPSAKWPILENLIQRNFVIVTCRNYELRSTNVRHRLNESPFYEHVHLIKANEYARDDLAQLVRRHIERVRVKADAATMVLLQSETFVAACVKALPSPHAIAYFFQSVLPRAQYGSEAELLARLRSFSSIKEAVVSLYTGAEQSEKLFLALVAVLHGQYSESEFEGVYDRCVQIASRLGLSQSCPMQTAMARFGDMVGSEPARQARYRDFDEAGIAFLHPTYREAILEYALSSPLERRWIYEGAKALCLDQDDGARELYDHVCAGFEILLDCWDELKREFSSDLEQWVPWKGHFDDYVQASYFELLARLAERAPDLVLDECKALLSDPLVDGARGAAVSAAFAATVLRPERGLALLAASDDLRPNDHAASGFAKVFDRYPGQARKWLEEVIDPTSAATKAFVISSLRFANDETFARYGLAWLEEFLDEDWVVKQHFMELAFAEEEVDDLQRLPAHFVTLFEAWAESGDERKRGFLVTLYHHNMLFFHPPEKDWLPVFKRLLAGPIGIQSEQSLVSACKRHLRLGLSNRGKAELIEALNDWIARHARDAEAIAIWHAMGLGSSSQ